LLARRRRHRQAATFIIYHIAPSRCKPQFPASVPPTAVHRLHRRLFQKARISIYHIRLPSRKWKNKAGVVGPGLCILFFIG